MPLTTLKPNKSHPAFTCGARRVGSFMVSHQPGPVQPHSAELDQTCSKQAEFPQPAKERADTRAGWAWMAFPLASAALIRSVVQNVEDAQ